MVSAETENEGGSRERLALLDKTSRDLLIRPFIKSEKATADIQCRSLL
jgi:hypothetical protein